MGIYVYCEHRIVMSVLLKGIEANKNKILNILYTQRR